MGSSAFDRGSSPELPNRETTRDGSAEPAADPALLESVLKQTLANFNSPGGLDRGEFDRLREVVRRNRGRPFDLDPVAVELVDALLRDQLPASLDRDAQKAMSAQIAQTLYEDPAAHDRFQALWLRLSSELQP